MTKMTASSNDWPYLAIALFIVFVHIAMRGFACFLAVKWFVICTP